MKILGDLQASTYIFFIWNKLKYVWIKWKMDSCCVYTRTSGYVSVCMCIYELEYMLVYCNKDYVLSLD